jgi:hypothetical protein
MRQKWSHSVVGYVFGKRHDKDVRQQERESIGDFERAVGFASKILTALKGSVGLAPQGLGALHIMILIF